METKAWKFPDSEPRTRMPAQGPWATEPDKMQWQDPNTGLPCLIVRGPSGSLCGYVGVSKGHPFFGVEYSQQCVPCMQKEADAEKYTWCEHSPESMLEVHGGITFTGLCNPHEGDQGICHVVEPGEDDKVWWLGFDTAHAGDLCPAHLRLWEEMAIDKPDRERYETYKDVTYMVGQVMELAKQLKDMT